MFFSIATFVIFLFKGCDGTIQKRFNHVLKLLGLLCTRAGLLDFHKLREKPSGQHFHLIFCVIYSCHENQSKEDLNLTKRGVFLKSKLIPKCHNFQVS